jgi:3,4-dihydroxy-2-butanone 4-phosphate synthase
MTAQASPQGEIMCMVGRFMATAAQFDSIDDVLKDIRAGKMVIVTDDADRENEGDLVMAAEKCTAASVNFMATHGRGLICAPLSEERAEALGLQRMVVENRETYRTDFTVSVDAARGVSTGISAQDRALTIRMLVDPSAKPQDLVQPGHVFPSCSSSKNSIASGSAPSRISSPTGAKQSGWWSASRS